MCRSYNGESFMHPMIIWSRHNSFNLHMETNRRVVRHYLELLTTLNVKKKKAQKQENKRPHPS